MINDVSVSPWLDDLSPAALLFKLSLFPLNARIVTLVHSSCIDVAVACYELLVSLSLSLCHTPTLRKGSRATSPQVRGIILTLQSIFIDFTINVAA